MAPEWPSDGHMTAQDDPITSQLFTITSAPKKKGKQKMYKTNNRNIKSKHSAGLTQPDTLARSNASGQKVLSGNRTLQGETNWP